MPKPYACRPLDDATLEGLARAARGLTADHGGTMDEAAAILLLDHAADLLDELVRYRRLLGLAYAGADAANVLPFRAAGRLSAAPAGPGLGGAA
jgi:hypothetical protein